MAAIREASPPLWQVCEQVAAAAGPAAPEAAKPPLPPPQQDAKAAESADSDLKGKLLVRPAPIPCAQT